MPPRRRNAPPTLFNNHLAVARDNHGGACCSCSLTVKHHQDKSQGSFSVRVVARFEGFDDPESTMLWLPLENMEHMNISFNHTRIPRTVTDQLRQDTSAQSHNPQFHVLDISMCIPGVVIVPKHGARLTPTETDRSKMAAFASICQATQLHIYVPTTDQTTALQQSLQRFIETIRAGEITSVAIDLGAARGGRGARVARSRIFHIAELPPPYQGNRDGKRARPESPGSRTSPPSKRLAIDLSSAGARVSGNTVSNADFSEPDVDFLPASSKVATGPSPSRPPAFTDASLNHDLRRSSLDADALLDRLLGALDAKLDTKLRAVLPAVLPAALRVALPERTLAHALKTSIGPLIEDRLLELVQEHIDAEGPLDDCLDTATTLFDERVEEAGLELTQVKDEFVKEIAAAKTEALACIEDTEPSTGPLEWTLLGLTMKRALEELEGRRVEGDVAAGGRTEEGRRDEDAETTDESDSNNLTFRRRATSRCIGSARKSNSSEAAAPSTEKQSEQAGGAGGDAPGASGSERAKDAHLASKKSSTSPAEVVGDSGIRRNSNNDDDGPGAPKDPAVDLERAERGESQTGELTARQGGPDGYFVAGSTTEPDTDTDDDEL